MEINKIVAWSECPPSVPAQISRVRGISPCRKYALIDWVASPVHVKHLSPVLNPPKYPYAPHTNNNWLLTGVDAATGQNLNEWMNDYERADDGRDIARSA